MRRPRELRARSCICGEARSLVAWVNVPVADGIKSQPREWRRAAAWLRRVADWWDYLADQQEQTPPLRRRLFVCFRKEVK